MMSDAAHVDDGASSGVGDAHGEASVRVPSATDAPTFAVEVITCVPEAWAGFVSAETGLVGRAFADKRVSLHVAALRDHGRGRHRCVDDAPYGGGAGMVLAAPPVHAAVAAARARTPGPVVMLSPRGAQLTQAQLQAWAEGPGMTLLCGRYEGFDERCHDYVDQVVSLGDFVLSGGDPAALCVVDGVVRLRAGTLGNEVSCRDESFVDGLLEYPQYTRPPTFACAEVPAVLRGGDHAAITRWRDDQKERLTAAHRPDLYQVWRAKRAAAGCQHSAPRDKRPRPFRSGT